MCCVLKVLPGGQTLMEGGSVCVCCWGHRGPDALSLGKHGKHFVFSIICIPVWIRPILICVSYCRRCHERRRRKTKMLSRQPCALEGGRRRRGGRGGGGEEEGGWRCWAEERGANALRRERRRAYSYCSCPPVNKGLIWVRM